VHQVVDGVVEAAEGGYGLHGRADGLALWVGLDLPADDSGDGDPEKFCGLLLGEAQKVPEAEDSEALGWGVVWAAALRELIETGAQEFEGLSKPMIEEDARLGLGEAVLERVVAGAQLGEALPQDEAQETIALEQGSESGSLQRGVTGCPKEQAFGEIIGGAIERRGH
jgi:hypothetical protein